MKLHPRIIVEPRYNGAWGIPDRPEFVEQDMQSMINQIKRHVDDVSGCTIEWDEDYVCSHCGHAWELFTEKDWETWHVKSGDCPFKPGSPTCCEDAIKEWEAENP